ncbi:MAG: tRNA-dihydrouridine synthase family protein [Acidobacteriota bacterium]
MASSRFLRLLPGALVMAPMTKGSNLPYRRLSVELGAVITVSEMTVARRLRQRRNSEFALIRRFEGEPCFGVQLAGTKPEEMAWAAALAEARGADFVDVNVGCPIDHFTRKGLGAAIGRQPNRLRRIVEAMTRAVGAIPVTVKIRLGWNDADRNYLEQARAAVEGGAAALFVHGRTRSARYRLAADWDAIGAVVAAVPVPVIGNGDLLFPDDIAAARARSGCAAVMTARGALIKPWIFREALHGYAPLSAEERLAIYGRYVELAREHWGADAHGAVRIRAFVRWHAGFWHRYVPRRADGSYPTMQGREAHTEAASPLEALLARGDDAALDYVTDALVEGRAPDAAAAPPPSAPPDLSAVSDRDALATEG